MQHRIWIAGIAAAALGAAGAVTAQAGPPADGILSGGLTVKGTFKTRGATKEQKKFKFEDTDNLCSVSLPDFSISYGGPTVRGSFSGSRIGPPSGVGQLEQGLRDALGFDGQTRTVNTLTFGFMIGRANFRTDGTVVMKWTINYQGDDLAPGETEPVKGKIKFKYKAAASGV